MKILCNACGNGFDVPPGSLEVSCPECGARITLTAMETRPGARGDQVPDPVALIGTVLGGYELCSILGGGGMGTVYEAKRTAEATFAAPDIAAVKVLSPAFTHDAQFVERFRREADALTRLRHPNLIEVYARGEHPSDAETHYYFVMERFFGEDLRSLMARGAVAPETTAAIVRQAAEGLAYAHGNGIVHRDVKPANILVHAEPTKELRVKVVDFGVAQLASSNYTLTSLTSSSLVLGTINYMSPEQRIDASEIDHRADVYALGVVAYELLTGRLPIGAFELPSELARVGRAADRAVLSALRRDPAHRPANVLAFAQRLDSALARRRLVPLATAAAVAAFLFAGGAGAWMVSIDPRAPQPKTMVQKVEPAQTLVKQAPPPSPVPPPYVAPDSIKTLAERMKQDAEYALDRSLPPPEPAEPTTKKKKPRPRKKPLVVKDTNEAPKPTAQAADAPSDEPNKKLGGKTQSIDFSDIQIQGEKSDSQSYPQSKLD